MKNFKKILKRSALVLMMVLATLGMGIAGPVPLPTYKKREDNYEVRTEQVEVKEDNIYQFKLNNLKQ